MAVAGKAVRIVKRLEHEGFAAHASLFARSPRKAAQRTLASGLADAAPIAQTCRVSMPSLGRPRVQAAPGALPVLYCDAYLVIVNKPSGLAAHRGWSDDHGDYVLTRVRDALGQRVHLIHRLDRATSGAIALVRDAALVEPLQRAFQDGTVEKDYLALTRGAMPEYTLVDYALPRGESRKGERVPARTEFRCLGVFEGRYALVQARPLTGRLHQIRRHLKHLFRPILGDTTYGDGKENRLFRERFGLTRLALHAHRLRLPHPVTGTAIEVEAPLPPDLAGPLAAMGLWAEPPRVPLVGARP